MEDDDPVHEAAYARIRRIIDANRVFVDSMLNSPPWRLAGNWKLSLVREDPQIVALRGRWRRDPTFRAYLRSALSERYGSAFADGLARVFLA
jgi:hypothetical protein